MKKILSFFTLSLLSLNFVLAQNVATEVWSANFGVQDTMLITPMTTDNFGNVYIAGFTLNPTSGADIAVVKYDAHGDTVWTAQYSGSGAYRDQATCINLDNNYNLVVGGFSYVSSTNKYDYIVLKYDSSGTQQWVYTYNGTGSLNDGITAITTYNNSIYATGTCDNASSLMDYKTIKLDSLGNLIWNVAYNYTNLYDIPYDIAVIDNNVFVTGGSQSGLTDWDYATIQYSLGGTPVDTLRITGTGFGFDHASQVITDNLGYVYITGAVENSGVGLDYKTLKMTHQGVIKWISTYDNPAHDDDIANSITVDLNGNVYVTGQSKNGSGNFDYCTIKYDSLGSTVWTRFYNNGHDDKAARITVDGDNNVYLTGSSGNGSNNDFATIGYNTDGDTLWTKRFNGAFNGTDEANFITEQDGYVYISGQSQINSTQYQYITIAYGQAKYKEVGDPFNEPQSRSLWYYPNEGQILNDTGEVANIEFYTLNQYPSLYFKKGTLSYVFSKTDTALATNDTIHRIDMAFMDTSNHAVNARIFPNDESSHFLNFYLPQCPGGVINCHGSKNLFIEDLYAGIDLYYSSNRSGEKHYFVIEPGAKYVDIAMKFTGSDSIHVSSGKYTLFGSIGNVSYDTLVAYEIDALGNLIPGTTQLISLFKDTVSQYYHFTTISFNASNSLVIMVKKSVASAQATPIANLWWSTFLGGTQDDMALDITTSPDNDSFVCGLTVSNDFPIFTGPIILPNQNAGNQDGYLIKFDEYAVPQWSTYYGGSQNDQLQSLAFNHAIVGNGEALYALGTTNSNVSMIGSSAGGQYFKNTLSGGNDAFIVRYDEEDGHIVWSSYIGGEGDDEGRSIAADNDGNIFIAGNTTSEQAQANGCLASSGNNFPLCNPGGGAYYQNTNKDSTDIFITSFDSANVLRWSTFYGSNKKDLLFEIHFGNPVSRSNNDNLILVGRTEKVSSDTVTYNGSVPPNGNFPLCDFSGGSDFFQVASGGFVSRFNSDGVLSWATNVNHTHSFQTVNSTEDDIIIAGFAEREGTGSCTAVTSQNVPVCSSGSSYNETDGQLYMMKFNKSSLSLQWSSLYEGWTNVLDPGGYLGSASQPPQHPVYTKTLDIASDWAKNFYVFGSYMNAAPQPFPTQSSTPSGMYLQSTFSGGLGNDLADAFILNFNEDNQRVWATYFGTPAGPSSDAFTHPLYVDLGAAITCFETKDLYIAGYSGQMNAQYPFVDPGIQPTGDSYFQAETSFPNTWDSFIARFDLESVGVSVKEKESAHIRNLTIFPNPNDGTFYLKFSEDVSGNANIYNSLGELLITIPISQKSMESKALNLSSLPSGIYFVTVKSGSKMFNQKFIKK